MESYIWLQTADGFCEQIEEPVAMFCPMICREVVQNGMGYSKSFAVSLPHCVTTKILNLILDYCRFYQVIERSEEERKIFEENLLSNDTKTLCELGTAAECLQLTPLVDLTCDALGQQVEGKTPQEISEIFHLHDSLDEEVKLVPPIYMTGYSRVKFVTKFYARKRQQLKERNILKDVEVEQELKDERSIDELLSFINGDQDGDTKGTTTNKNKKKNKRKKQKAKDLSQKNTIENHNKENFDNALEASSSKHSEMQDVIDVDDLDPSLMAEIDSALIKRVFVYIGKWKTSSED
uniref:SKP1-like protein 21 n=1 Tax=Cicer arietinum TaxID=3827 RepID=A0A1S3EIM8_CICAR|nr:SKP1-like protein 21 [Cicer arietinum]